MTTINVKPKENQKRPDLRWWDFLSGVLIIIAFFTAASRLEATRWSPMLSIIPTIAVIGCLIGLALGQSRFPRWLSFILAFLYGTFFISWQLGLLTQDNFDWKERFVMLGSRAQQALGQFLGDQVVSDSILFIISMAIVFWVLSAYGGYALTRHGNAWLAILPLGLTIFIIHTFDSAILRRSLYLAVYLFLGLALVSRVVYIHQQRRWKENQIVTPTNLSYDFLRIGIITVTSIVFVSWTIPALANSLPLVVEATQPIRQSWSDLRERWENAFSSLRSSVSVYVERYDDSVSLGQGTTLRDVPLFVVTPPENRPLSARFYWRARTYDRYENGTWENTDFLTQTFDPLQDQYNFQEYQNRWEETFEIRPLTYIGTLYSPSQPFWVSLPAQVNLIQNPNGTVEINSFQTDSAVRPNQSYTTQASLTVATVKQLREAGIEYPEGILDRYLQLPETITTRIKQLAEEITSDFDNPYDKAAAITQYLRENITYQETIPDVPNGREPIDWFLFDLKEGFCNYYATAEVLLLRSVGIPARWSVGYAQGERLEGGQYVVRQLDGHSWPEVYFPNYGWIEFEPTAAQSDIFRLSGDDSSTIPLDPLDENPDELRRQQLEELQRQAELDLDLNEASVQQQTWSRIFIGFIAFLLIGLVAFLLWKNRNKLSNLSFSIPIFIETSFLKIGFQPPRIIRQWARNARLPLLSKSYEEINRALSRLGSKPLLNHTPSERAALLVHVLPPAQDATQRLLHEYQLETFASQPANGQIAHQAGIEIRQLSFRAYLNSIFNKFIHLNKKS